MKILLLNPRYYESQFRYKVNKVGAPLGMAYIASILRNAGHTVQILDMELLEMELESLSDYLNNFKPDLVGLHCTTPVFNQAVRCVKIIRGSCPKAFIVLGGPHPTLMPQSVLEDVQEADYILRGEAEFTMLELVRRLDNKGIVSDIDGIPGLGIRRNGKAIISEETPLINDLDLLPLPAYDLLPMEKISEKNKLAETGTEEKFFTMITSRGCPYRCIFCNAPVLYGHRFRGRSAGNVVNEMAELNSRYGITHIAFYDSSFTINKARVEQICNEILDRSLSVTWRARVRADRVDEPLMRLMKKAGCIALGIGVEAGTQKSLDILQKKSNMENIEETFRATKEIGLWTVAYFMLGIPGESIQDALQTIEFAKKLDPDWALFSTATPLPGTKLYEMAKDNLVTKDWSKFRFSAKSPVLAYDGMSDKDLGDLMDYAFRSFYLRKEWLTNRLKKISNSVQMDKILDSLFYYLDKTLEDTGAKSFRIP